MRDLKYLAAYTLSLCLLASFYMGPQAYWATFLVAFLVLPIIESLLPTRVENFSPAQEVSRTNNRLFDLLLYLNVPIVYGLLWQFVQIVTQNDLSGLASTGIILSMGVILGVNGINVAHELGHRESRFEQSLSILLLLPSHYLQFFIEHNLGHHKYVATAQDPSTARYNEPIYTYLPRSVYGVYTKAWGIEADVLKKDQRSFWSVHNRMIWLTALQLGYYAAVWYWFGGTGLIYLILAGVIGFTLLESINYIEHYGLVRKLLPSGRPEPVSPIHSWNSDHQIGRIVLYELTRHSDHHFKATRPYQILRHMDESPQMPYGYPTSVVLAWISPVWFRIMNKRVLAVQNRP
jgi:alkane 1-monooxygenase